MLEGGFSRTQVPPEAATARQSWWHLSCMPVYAAALRGAAGERGAIRGQTVEVFGRAAWRRPSRCEFENGVVAAGRLCAQTRLGEVGV